MHAIISFSLTYFFHFLLHAICLFINYLDSTQHRIYSSCSSSQVCFISYKSLFPSNLQLTHSVPQRLFVLGEFFYQSQSLLLFSSASVGRAGLRGDMLKRMQ